MLDGGERRRGAVAHLYCRLMRQRGSLDQLYQFSTRLGNSGGQHTGEKRSGWRSSRRVDDVFLCFSYSEVNFGNNGDQDTTLARYRQPNNFCSARLGSILTIRFPSSL